MAELNLVDFDWNLEFVMGSSAVSTVDQPLLHLHLDVSASNDDSASSGTANVFSGSTLTPLDIELDRPKLKTLISQLEAALGS